MVEEQKQAPVVEERVVERPQSFREFFKSVFFVFIGVLLFIFLLGSVFKTKEGLSYLSPQQMGVGLSIVVVGFILIPSLIFFRRKPEKFSEVTPVDPVEEMHLLEEKYARAGRNITLLYNDSDPWEGEGAGQPEVFQYFGHETLADGTKVPIVLVQGSITKLPTKFLPRRYIETATFSAAGTRKRPTEPGPRQQRPLFVAQPSKVQVVIPERKLVGKEEEKKEEEEEEE